MGWNAELGEACTPGDSVTFATETSGYEAGMFTAPKNGIYRFTLLGSGGYRRKTGTGAEGGQGGKTVGYLLLKKGQSVYVGCGIGEGHAAWVASVNPGNTGIWDIAPESLYFVAGGGGGGGGSLASSHVGVGGAGGGLSGGDGENAGEYADGGRGGTQAGGGQGYGKGGSALGTNNGAYGLGSRAYDTYGDDGKWAQAGSGGDGYYGGGAGGSTNRAGGGGGGSGYVYLETLTVGSRSYMSVTEQGGGAASDTAGSVTVEYHAKAELPVSFDGVMIMKLIFNGVEVGKLIYDGVRIFARRCWACLRRMAARFGCPAAIPESFSLRCAGHR